MISEDLFCAFIFYLSSHISIHAKQALTGGSLHKPVSTTKFWTGKNLILYNGLSHIYQHVTLGNKSHLPTGYTSVLSTYRGRTLAFILLDSGTSKVKSLLVRQKVYQSAKRFTSPAKNTKCKSLKFDLRLKNSICCNPGKLTMHFS